MSRTKRQFKILEIINTYDVETQEDLVSHLKEANFKVTQATISRDIKELGLIKVKTENNKYKYAVDNGTYGSSQNPKFLKIFRESVLSIDYGDNIIVVKTLSGSASSAALLVDKSGFESVLGCIAGDDTFFIAVREKEQTSIIAQKLREIIS